MVTVDDIRKTEPNNKTINDILDLITQPTSGTGDVDGSKIKDKSIKWSKIKNEGDLTGVPIPLTDDNPVFFDTAKHVAMYHNGGVVYLEKDNTGALEFFVQSSTSQIAGFWVSDTPGIEKAQLELYDAVSGREIWLQATPLSDAVLRFAAQTVIDINQKFFSMASQGIELNAYPAFSPTGSRILQFIGATDRFTFTTGVNVQLNDIVMDVDAYSPTLHRRLVNELLDGNYYYETTYLGGNLTKEDWWTDSGKGTLIREIVYSYS